MKIHASEDITWTITNIVEETPDTKTIVLKAPGTRPSFIAGQYVTVRLPGFEPAEGKSYSISSTPNEETLALTVKAIGGFSKALLAHHVGDTLTTSPPYGFFYPEPDEASGLAFVVGGIGITPCISIIESLLEADYTKPITLFYSNRTVSDIVFKNRLDERTRQFSNFTVSHFITRESETQPGFVHDHLSAAIIYSAVPHPAENDFFICGSISFTKELWRSLKDAGVSATRIYTEGFF